jgi:DNA-binding protein YbaB
MTSGQGFAQVRRHLEEVRALKDRIATLVGRAESPDGLVRVEFTDADGLSALDVNPRAMRLQSQELSEAILRTVRAARADLDEQRRAALADVMGTGFDPTAPVDPAALRGRIDEAADAFRRTSADSNALMDLVRRATGR